jgi:hypothetical protein
VTYRLAPEADGAATRVFVVVEYSLQGALAQFSRSSIAQELGRRLVGEFAANLDARLGGGGADGGTAREAASLDAGRLVWVAAASAEEKLSVRLDWTPWGVHAPFHLAAQKGWFHAAGLDVEIEDGNGSVTTVQIVGQGRFDVGHASLAPMMIARDKGLPVRAIANFARKSDVGLLVPKGSGITSPKQLVGKELVFTAGSLGRRSSTPSSRPGA